MLDEFFCLNCRKYKSLLLKSPKKIGRYQKEQVCTACNERAKKNLVDSKKSPEELSKFSTLKIRHYAKGLDNRAKKSYINERLYNYMKDNDRL